MCIHTGAVTHLHNLPVNQSFVRMTLHERESVVNVWLQTLSIDVQHRQREVLELTREVVGGTTNAVYTVTREQSEQQS
jgi:hypothetical protein